MFRFLLTSLALSTTLSAQSLDDAVIPRKTEVFFTLERSLSTKTASSGDKFYGRVSVPITHNDQVVIPVGSYLIGHVDTSRKPGYLRGKSKIALTFDTIILPDGTTRKLEAVLQSAEGYETDLRSEKGEIQPEGNQPSKTIGGAARGGVMGAVIGVMASGGLKGAGVGGAIGAAAGALAGLFQKGEHVTLPKGSSIIVQLESDVRFVKPTPPRRGIRLNS